METLEYWHDDITHKRGMISQQSKHTVPVQVVKLTTCIITTIRLSAGEWRLGSRGVWQPRGGGLLAYLQAVDDMLCVKVRVLQPPLEYINKQLQRVCTMGTCTSSQTGEQKGSPQGSLQEGQEERVAGGVL